MFWFWDIYCSPADRTDPRASPLRGNLVNLPPAFVATCEFDPLRDEGIEYAEALAAAGVPVAQLQARGHIHTSLMMVDVVITGVSVAVAPCVALAPAVSPQPGPPPARRAPTRQVHRVRQTAAPARARMRG